MYWRSTAGIWRSNNHTLIPVLGSSLRLARAQAPAGIQRPRTGSPLARGRAESQRRNRLDLEQRARARQRRHADRRARRRRSHVEVLVADLAERADVGRNIDEVVVD